MTSFGFMSSCSVICIVKFFLISLLSGFTVILPANFTSFLLTSWDFLVIGEIFMAFFYSFSGGIFNTVGPLSTMVSFSVPSIFTVMLKLFFFCRLRALFRLLFLSSCRYHFLPSRRVPYFLVVSGFGSANVREVPLFAILTYWFSGWAFMVRVPIWRIALSAFSFFWSLFPCSSLFYCLCYFLKGILWFFSWFNNSSCGMVFLLFFLSYVFYCIWFALFGISKTFSFNNLSRSFLLVIDVIVFDGSNSVLKSGKSHSFSKLNIFSQWFSGVSVSVCFLKKSLRDLDLFFSSKQYLLSNMISLSIFILSGSVQYSDRVLGCVASSPIAPKKSCCIVCSFIFHPVPVVVSWLLSGPLFLYCFLFVY